MDGTDVNLGNQIANYFQNIVLDFYQSQQKETLQTFSVSPEIRMLYNPQLKGAPNFVPGVVALVLLIVCVMMTAIAIVKEKKQERWKFYWFRLCNLNLSLFLRQSLTLF